MSRERRVAGVVRRSFGWGGSMALVRMVCSFISIKITAVYLGPSGLALIAQLANFIGMFQSMLGQGLVAGTIRLSAQYGDDRARCGAVYATALRMGVAMAVALAVVLAAASPWIAGWLLTDRSHTVWIALSGVAVAAAILTDVLHGAMSSHKEIALIGISTIASTVTGLCVFGPFTYLWGVGGGLCGLIVVAILACAIAAGVAKTQSHHVRLAEFVGAFDRVEYRKILKFYPMLIVNGVLPPLVLIMVRSTLTSHLGLHSAGLWQATWRLSEAYLVILIFSVSMYFMPGMGEHAEAPREQRRHILRTFAMVSAVTTALAVAILILKAPIVAIIFGPGFDEVTTLLPLQLLGDVLKMGGWILAMALVGTLRTRWFIVVTAATSIVFVGLSEWLIPSAGIHGVLQAYVCSGAVHIALAAYGLRDILVGRRPLLGAPTARNE